MRPDLGKLVCSLSTAALSHVDGNSVELARNVAQTLWMLHSSGWPVDEEEAFSAALEAIHHRLEHEWIDCASPAKCADAMASAWVSWVAGLESAQ